MRSSTSALPRSTTTYDDEEPAYEPEAELEDRYRERPNVRRLPTRRRRDDSTTSSPTTSRRRRSPAALRPVAGGRPANGDVRVHLVIPKSFNDAQQVADKFKDPIPVVLNLQSTESDLNKRLIDFASGPHLRARWRHAAHRRQGLHAHPA